ncbi:hypothetical protein [Streptomyces sp. NPDC000410]|uniref:hypothetical protein n=1 Tax=Streptomyces sp. NPDC000410 TaxID=3154254 RepID=UPI00331C207D
MENTGNCWFRLPPGYHDIDPTRLRDVGTQLQQELPIIHDDVASGERAMHQTRAMLGLLDDLYEQGMMHAAFGLHRGVDSELCISLVTVSNLSTGAPNATLAVSQCGIELTAGGFGTLVDQRLVDLACGRPAVFAARKLPYLPAQLRVAIGLETVAPDVFQARLAVARPHGPRVVVVDLTTCAVSMANEYTDILLGIGQSLSFVDPDATPEPPPRPSRLLEFLL